MRDSTRPVACDAKFDWAGLMLFSLWAVMAVCAIAYLVEVRFL
jgi:hypothetical protein